MREGKAQNFQFQLKSIRERVANHTMEFKKKNFFGSPTCSTPSPTHMFICRTKNIHKSRFNTSRKMAEKLDRGELVLSVRIRTNEDKKSA